MLTRVLVTVGLATGALLVGAVSAMAGDGAVEIDCSQDLSLPGCTVGAGTREVVPSGSSSVRPQRGSGEGGRICRDRAGREAPCSHPELGWMGSDGCYYRHVADSRPGSPLAPPPESEGGQGAWFTHSCTDPAGIGGSGGLVWLPTAPDGAPAAAPPPPIVVARMARDRLVLPRLVIGASPRPDDLQLVRLPTWLWVERESWQPQQATASVPGLSVTATATPTTVRWAMGDGATVTCDGPGTPYQSGVDPREPSPTCGHTYTRSSAGQPDEAFAGKATVTWRITWSGGGESGTLPPLFTTASAAFRVAESQGLVTSLGRQGGR